MKLAGCLLVIFIAFNSCCHFTSQECSCNPPEPFFVESTKEWIKPEMSQELIFISQDTTLSEKTIYNFYSNEDFFIGGDECGTDYPSFSFDYKFKNYKYGTSLVTVRAVMDVVRFTIDPYSYYEPNVIAEFNILDNQFINYHNFYTISSDTTIDNIIYQKVIFKKTKPSELTTLFNEVTFVKGIGLIAFQDTLNINWVRK